LSLHLESVMSILKRTRARVGGTDLFEAGLAGQFVGCIGITEPQGGSDLLALQTRAEPTADGWGLSGQEPFISLSKAADRVLVLARTGGTTELSLFAVPRDLYSIRRTFQKMGTRSLETCVLSFEEVRLPADALVGPQHQALELVIDAMTCERMAIVAMILGTLHSSIQIARTHLTRRATRTG